LRRKLQEDRWKESEVRLWEERRRQIARRKQKAGFEKNGEGIDS
jgi:hypothetical protein